VARVTHTALIHADGIEWRGQRYRSLSVVARKITGARWSGPRFFGVRRQLDSHPRAGEGDGEMGRLTLNMLLSFAQFEREIAGERIRDKIAASKKKDMWMGGNVPLGYDVKDRKLIVSEPEAATVRLIFRRYAELGSVSLLRAELDRLGIVSKRRGTGGRLAGGQHFSRGALYLMLQNRIYRPPVKHDERARPR